MTLEPEIDPVEERLRARPYLDDEGFTGRVMARLPARRAPRWPVLGGLVAAAGIAAATLPALVAEALSAAARVSTMPPAALVASGAVLVVLSATALGRVLWE